MQKRKIGFYLIIGVLISLIVFFSYKIFLILSDKNRSIDEIKKIKEQVVSVIETKIEKIDDDGNIKEVTEPQLILDFPKLRSINSDTVAWISIPNTNIDYPIVKTNNNSFYLDHSFYKESNINGWIFESADNSSSFNDQNTVIFGHNTNSHTMFSDLKDIYNGILGTNIVVRVYLENEVINYKVFSVYLEKPSDTSNISKYINVDMLKNMQEKSKLKIDANFSDDSKIITLSTCNNVTNDRLVLHAIRGQ